MSFGSTSSCLCWKALSGNWIAKNVFIIFAALSSSRWILNPNSSRFKREAATSNTVKNSWQCFHWILSSGKFMRKFFESISFNYSTTGKTWKLSSASENLFAVLKNKKKPLAFEQKKKNLFTVKTRVETECKQSKKFIWRWVKRGKKVSGIVESI